MTEQEMFKEVFEYFQKSYPAQGLKLLGNCVVRKGEIEFNTSGFNLLYNLRRLCESIKEELL